MEENSRVRITVLLDDKTLNALREYMYSKNGTTNVSKAIMSMVKDYEQKDKK
jgi:hypothetical protein